MKSTLTVKGQITIPKAIREYLGLKPGDTVKFFQHPDGTVVILPTLPITALKGMVAPRKGKPVSIEEMDEAVADSVAARYRLATTSRKAK